MKSNFLNQIKPLVQERLRKRYQSITPEEVLTQLNAMKVSSTFTEIFHKKFSIIAEIKFSSPSQGDIASYINPVDIAKSYIDSGAAAISILTEPHYFKGSIDYLKQVHEAFPETNILMKDFVMDPVQILDGIHGGASAVLLIVAFLEKSQFEKLYHMCSQNGISALVEVHDESEMEQALELGCEFIGVNNRNLKSLEVSLDVSRELASYAQAFPNRVFISESGIKSTDELRELKDLGYRGALIGSSLMRSENTSNALEKLMEGIC